MNNEKAFMTSIKGLAQQIIDEISNLDEVFSEHPPIGNQRIVDSLESIDTGIDDIRDELESLVEDYRLSTQPKPKDNGPLRWWMITGREHGDDEDSVYWSDFKETREQAEKNFLLQILGSERAVKRAQADKDTNGEGYYINAIASSETPIKDEE